MEMMRKALLLAKKAFMAEEVPVGAVIVHKGTIIAEAHNETEARNDPTAHAELLCIQRAAKAIGDWRLSECILYVTLEPCAMCKGAILQSRLNKVIWAAPNLFDVGERISMEQGEYVDESAQLMRMFFRKRRMHGDNSRSNCAPGKEVACACTGDYPASDIG